MMATAGDRTEQSGPIVCIAKELVARFGPLVAALVLLQFVTYTYLFTSILFTDHTFPNVWLYDYPSFKTRGEGRWMADLIILLQGGSGVQAIQMFAAAALQAANGVLLATLLGLTRRLDVALIAAGLCLYPAFVDYYSFAVDHLTFVLGDSFIIVAFLIWQMARPSWRTLLAASVLLMLSLACYPPKVALIGLMAIACALLELGKTTLQHSHEGPEVRSRRFLSLIVAPCLGIALYFLSTRLTLSFDAAGRTYINSLSEALSAAGAAFGTTIRELLLSAPFLPWPIAWLPAVIVLVGLSVVTLRAAKRGKMALAVAILAIAAVPIALQAPHIINKNTWLHAGRLHSAHGYAVVFLAGCWIGLSTAKVRWAGRALAGLFCCSLIVTGSQQSNAAAFKTTYDLSLMTRLLARAEPFLSSPGKPPRALVIVGQEPDFAWHRFVRNQPRGVQLRYRTLAPYRQVATLNFLCGFDAFRSPSPEELRAAEDSMPDRPIWPREGSVYLQGDTVVILLQDPATSAVRTWSR